MKHAPAELLGKNDNGYGLGWSVGGRPQDAADLGPTGSCGHGGAYSTNMQIDLQHQLITVFLGQHAGNPGKDGAKILPAFRQAALAAVQPPTPSLPASEQ